MIKKLTATIVAITMVFSLTACNNSSSSNDNNSNNNTSTNTSSNSTNNNNSSTFPVSTMSFDEFVDTLPVEFIGEESMDLNFLFLNPENYGFEETLLTLPSATDEEIEESIQDTIRVLSTLQSYDREVLDTQQKLTYDVVEHYLTQVLDLSEYGLLDRGYLGSFVGYQAQLPLLLNEFTFTNRNDLDSYFNILEKADETFQHYAEVEERKIEAGVGMPQLIIDKVIEQCVNFTNEEDNFLIEAINTKIDGMDFLNDVEKAEAKEKNTTLVTVNFTDAYKNLGEALSALEGREDDNGLWSLENGLDYYEDVLQFYTGTSMTVKEIEMETLQVIQDNKNLIQEIYFNNFDEVNDFLGTNMIVAEFDTVEENIEFFGEKLVADFPSIGELNYTVTQVPKEMQDNFSPAAYVLNQIDSPMDTPESIYLNGEYSSALYTTIAHEGYPGHMYQNAFYKQLEAPAIRYIIDYPGYSEGWATYVENDSIRYTDLSETVQAVWKANNVVSQMYYIVMDIDIHYNGFGRDAFNEKYSEIFGLTRGNFDGLYEIMLETPGNYPKYFFSAMKFQQMHDETELALGDLFSNIDFHNVLLVAGSAPFDILQSQLDIYIEETLANSTQNLETDETESDVITEATEDELGDVA